MAKVRRIFHIPYVLLILFGVGLTQLDGSMETDYEDADLDLPQLARKYGYPVETHEVETKDGYILTMHRIPSAQACSENSKSPVLILPGFTRSSDDFVITGPGKALGYLLADTGYDVWMGNGRGTYYSKKHIKLKPSSPSFWDFSFHEFGIYDLPAMIDYVLNTTCKEKLYYIGYSQGTTTFYVTASELPQYNQKIRLMISLAPFAYASHLRSPIFRILSNVTVWLKDFVNKFGSFGIPGRHQLSKILQTFCKDKSSTQSLCINLFFFAVGYNYDQLNKTTFPIVLSHVSSASIKAFINALQLINSGKFHRYDYGLKNMFVYGQMNPPEYNLTKVTAPVVLMYSVNDWLVNVKDVDILSEELQNVVLKYKIPDEKFNHADFIIASNAPSLINEKVMQLLAQY